MKRLIGAILVAVLFFLFTATSNGVLAAADTSASSSSIASSRNLRGEPVTVNETYSKVDVVGTATPAPEVTEAPTAAASAEPTASPQATQEPTATATASATEAPTPTTGDLKLPYIFVAVSLILFCSGGLLLLRRI